MSVDEIRNGNVMSGEPKKVLQSTLWLGTAGALLIIGGISALLASNWVRVPFVAQVLIAFTPLVCGWVGYLWLMWRGTNSLAQSEILGIVWSGGVICSIALLGRILQFSSSSFLFCLTVTLLLLPIAFAVRSTMAWLTTLGFAIATAGCQIDKNNNLLAIAVLLPICGVVYARLSWAWREEGLGALGQRWLEALSTIPVAITTGIALYGCFDNEFLSFLPILALPLMVGALLERNEKPLRRPLMLVGSIAFCITALVLIGVTHRSASFGWLAGCFLGVTLTVLACFGRILLQKEGLFLLLIPIATVNLAFGGSLLCLTLALGVGAAVIAVGVRTGQRMLANEGLIFTIVTAFVLFAKTDMTLTLQGFFLVLSGIAMIALNFILTRLNKKEVTHVA